MLVRRIETTTNQQDLQLVLFLKMIAKKHTYGLTNKISNYFFVMMSIISVVIGLLFLIGAINLFSIGKEINLSSVFLVVGILFACIVWSPVAFIFMAHLITDVDVDKDGISFQFLWKKYSVKWGDLAEIRHIKPFGLFTNKNSHIVIVNSELTFIHRLYGLLYGGKYQSAILIHKKISHYDLLIKNISTQVRKKSQKYC